MRMLEIKMNYEAYRKVADAILEVIPFSAVNMEYSDILGKGFFYFWDVAYIPPALLKFAKYPPKTHENVEILQEKILKALNIKKIKGDHECSMGIINKIQDSSFFIVKGDDGMYLAHQSVSWRTKIWYCPYCRVDLNEQKQK